MRMTLAAAAATLALAACGDTTNAQNEAYFTDKPAHVSCWAYHAGKIYDGQTKGKIKYDEGGRLNFVDAKTGRLVVVEGECVVWYAN